ncbi:hypothetical protein JGS22_002785 [Streptomyces sp. P38-E01]|uniref:Uncharacterized protein n=1 Tax=Streptomyces tardus TaxID=2780544 RepID=A0A949JHX3_9ACTN|nr:hypothetical protein [Streptomyces tardus]MBU7596589.1 hypothetical protein [Streptomyces tardus]
MAEDWGAGSRSTGGSGADLHVGDGTLVSLKKQLDLLLLELDNRGVQEEIRSSTVGAGSYGDFAGARELATHQARVHQKLEAFSRIFGEQIEALGIAAQISEKGFQNVEADAVQRLRAIQQNAYEHYKAPKDAPTAGQDAKATDDDEQAAY